MSATEVARRFSDVLNRVAAGEEVEIVRNGLPVAVIRPLRPMTVSAERFDEILRQAPPVDDEFLGDVDAIRAEIGPPDDPWA